MSLGLVKTKRRISKMDLPLEANLDQIAEESEPLQHSQLMTKFFQGTMMLIGHRKHLI